MDANFSIAEAEWLAQLAEMRKTIADLKAEAGENRSFPAYGEELDCDSDTGPEDIFDLIEEDKESSYSSDEITDVLDLTGVHGLPDYNNAWLYSQCMSVASTGAGLSAEDLQTQITSLLASDAPNDELQMQLIDIIGYGDLDFVSTLLKNRREIAISSEFKTQPKGSNGVFENLQSKEQREEALRVADIKHKSKVLAPAAIREQTEYPHVYKQKDAGGLLGPGGRKYTLPKGSNLEHHLTYEEMKIPPVQVGTLAPGQKLVSIDEMDGLCKATFKGYKSLNRMQSLVYPVAYKTSENMLICAPTGAGKTDAAMLTILNTIAHNVVPNPTEAPEAIDFALEADEFKIVYVAPMKALAAEVTDKLGKRLSWLGVKVREYTGDMQLTKREVMQTQVIVTTPEKWDVITRKSTGDTELVQKVRLLIIDEVHMLHDERGAVLESLVARTQRQVESTQSLIRIVGLSATLPNYIDVADFLMVNRYAGLFYFDQSFRPVPLEQHFIGAKGKANSKQSRENIESIAHEKCREMLEQGHQIMIFVHSRKDTVNTARNLIKAAREEGWSDLLDCSTVDGYDLAIRDLKSAKGRELKELVPAGLGVHHAGMARSDRNKIEQLFSKGHIGVLCCTATLAWGVNLPAAAVIIKGTQLYSADAGKFVDVGILDVLQIFGRAGRPQFQATGIGFIITSHDKFEHYLNAVTQQLPIESKFSKRLVDNLNAEIALGTVTSISEAVQWLGYSYLFVRMQRATNVYGIDWSEIRDDPQLVGRRRKLIVDAARTLVRCQMIIFNETTEELRAKDVGRIASQYYILHTSIEIFNAMMTQKATEADVLKMISQSGEFDQIQSRDNERQELETLRENFSPCKVAGEISTNYAKTNILLQSYISRASIMDFALVSDSAYVAQNAARICRALFMIALNRRWGHQCLVMLSLCQSIEKRVWSFQHPFHQYDLPQAILRNLDENSTASSIETMRDMEPAEIGSMVHNHGAGKTLAKLIQNFPTLSVEAEIAPLNRDVLRIKLFVTPDFRWNDRYHGTAESFWIWVEDSESSEIYHHEYFILSRKKLYDDHEIDFTIPLSDPIPTQIYVRAVSDRWLGAETVTPISFQHLIRPDTESVYTDLLNLQPLSIKALDNVLLEEIYAERFQFFNPMQTQIFHTLYHTNTNVLLGSPTGSGKTVAAELAMWQAFRDSPGSKVVYIAPMKALVRERVQDWSKRLTNPMGLKLVELTGDNTPDTRTIRDANIIVTTPEKWDGISRSWQTRSYVRQVSLVIIDEIHLLGGDRGPILEIIVSRMNYIASQSESKVRLLGMSTACANATDLGNWLGVKQGLFNFRHSVRPVPLEIFIDGFPEQRGFCPLMQSMNRPTFLAIKTHSPDKPVIVFVASRRQTRLTAKDLINYCGMEDNPRRFVKMSEEDLQLNLAGVKDEALCEALSFGIGLHHAGLVESDRQLAEELFANNKIQILVATSTLAWGVNLPAHLVVVKGTEFFDAKLEGYKDMDLTDVLQMLGRAGRPQFDNSGIARIFTKDAKKAFYKHFLHTGFPVESSLHNVLDNHLGAEISAGTVATNQDALDYLTWTFFFRRLHKNPSYYGLEISTEEHNTVAAQQLANEYMIELVDKSLNALAESQCIELHSDGAIMSTAFGKIMSYYYLSHLTVGHLVKKATSNATFTDVLAWMCAATEFDDLPVRHNEDLINAELAKSLPLDVAAMGDMPMWDPHVKAFLLLQAHISRIELPISDYVGDLNSVLDQSIRIIQASIDILAELGFAISVKQMISLLQCFKSARWPTDNFWSILPGTHVGHGAKGKTVDIVDGVEAGTRSKSGADTLMRKLAIPPAFQQRFHRALTYLPALTLGSGNVSALGFEISLKRLNFHPSPDFRIYSPKYPKIQTEGYFVIVSEAENGNLIALKRVSWVSSSRGRSHGKSEARNKPSATTKVKFEGFKEDTLIDVTVLSDSYPGMEWSLKGLKIPAIPKVEVDDKKKPR